jgi:hypothetical protein
MLPHGHSNRHVVAKPDYVANQAVIVSRLVSCAPFFDKLLPACCSRYAGSSVTVRASEAIEAIIRSRRGCADRLQFGRRKPIGKPVPAKPENVRY